jgi:GNAT superfamily N-acetyltransferase
MAQQITIAEADLSQPAPAHQRDIVAMTAAYALDPMGNGGPLPEGVLDRLILGLQNHPQTIVFLAYDGEKAVGIATCFQGFSTFNAKSLINIHDFAVLPNYREQGIGKLILAAVEQKAKTLGCCKVTLEVQENNTQARNVYENSGYAQAIYGQHTGGSLFYTKTL